MPPALVAELAQHTTNFYLLAFSLRKPSHIQLESIAPGDNYSLYRFTPESEEKFTGKFPRLRMRWYLYRQYFLSTSNYRDGFNAGPLSRLVPTRFLPAGLGERDRPERLIPTR